MLYLNIYKTLNRTTINWVVTVTPFYNLDSDQHMLKYLYIFFSIDKYFYLAFISISNKIIY